VAATPGHRPKGGAAILADIPNFIYATSASFGQLGLQAWKYAVGAPNAEG